MVCLLAKSRILMMGAIQKIPICIPQHRYRYLGPGTRYQGTLVLGGGPSMAVDVFWEPHPRLTIDVWFARFMAVGCTPRPCTWYPLWLLLLVPSNTLTLRRVPCFFVRTHRSSQHEYQVQTINSLRVDVEEEGPPGDYGLYYSCCQVLVPLPPSLNFYWTTILLNTIYIHEYR